ncbi:hypothetical protein [Inmirania thermothiophila]|uniref:DUF2244 domain-containing protein n=1 Tax=Inmirania thermothiophila TaxID=1750597 RepID=A0A3N1Y0K1_9GAMM|nr:hypothetical protein [Inmirania thermothiophila]ROR32364.1 hypothetical protein EDC57_1562 [Inmirania thermothiophila]
MDVGIVRSIDFNAAANLAAAVFFLAVPVVVVLGLAWWGRLRVRRPALALAAVMVYEALVLYSAVWGQFHRIDVDAEGRWLLHYWLPARTVVLGPRNVAAVRAAPGDPWTWRTVRVVVETRDGRRLRSTQFGRERTQALVRELRALVR